MKQNNYFNVQELGNFENVNFVIFMDIKEIIVYEMQITFCYLMVNIYKRIICGFYFFRFGLLIGFQNGCG